MFIGVFTCKGRLKCQRVLVSAASIFFDKVICRNSGFTFQTFLKQNEQNVILPLFLEGFPFQLCKNASHATFFKGMIPSYNHSCTFLHLFLFII